MRTAPNLAPSVGAMLVIPAAALLAWWMGAAVADGGRPLAVALGMAGAGLVLPLVTVTSRRLRSGVLAVEVPIVLLLVSNLTFRVRSTQQLTANPLDTAGQFRVACIGLAALLGMAAFLTARPAAASAGQRLTSLPFRLYVAYVLVVFVGVPLSFNPFLTAYRGIELAAALMVMLGARKSVGDEATSRMESTLYWSTVALIGSVWLGVVVSPSKAIVRLANEAAPIPYNLQGVIPALASNAVGALGAILAVWSLARIRSKHGSRLHPWLAYMLAAVGIASLMLAQYRTGYIATTVAVVLLLLLRRKWNLAGLLLLASIAVLVWKPSLITAAEPYVLRGQTATEAHELTGRVTWWEAALPVWKESPLIGRGLLTASRYEVFARLGQFTTAGLHSTWIEALVGTGVIGLVLLVLAYLVSLGRALVRALPSYGWTVPFVLLMVLGVRSLTGNTFESLQYEAVMFLWLALSLQDGTADMRAATADSR
jgi:O-antigen ligase/polysaccharide polymerase Wzy-like membrane protein